MNKKEWIATYRTDPRTLREVVIEAATWSEALEASFQALGNGQVRITAELVSLEVAP